MDPTTPSPQSLALAKAATILRGLLAEPSGEEDRPWQALILQTLASAEALEYAAQAQAGGGGETSVRLRPVIGLGAIPIESVTPPLLLERFVSGEAQVEAEMATETWRSETIKRLADYREQHSAAPDIFCLPGFGIVYRATAETQGTGSLRQRIALVTGAAGAIGHGICRGLLEAGACVAAADLSAEGLQSLMQDFSRAGGTFDGSPARLLTVVMDVTNPDSVAQGFARVAATWGGVDIVIINAGIAHVAALTELELATFQKLEKVNVEGTLLTLAEGARWLKRQGTGGDMVLVSTKNVFAPGARFGAYSATKAASHQLARIASLELAEFDIRVNMVAPDGVFSDGDAANKVKSGLWAAVGPDRMKARGLNEQGLEDYYRNRNLLKARVTARHVANAVLFFVTRQTPTTGATIPIDGGLPDATPR